MTGLTKLMKVHVHKPSRWQNKIDVLKLYIFQFVIYTLSTNCKTKMGKFLKLFGHCCDHDHQASLLVVNID